MFLGGALVLWSGSPVPDLLIGTLIASLVVWGGLRILRDARASDGRVPAAEGR